MTNRLSVVLLPCVALVVGLLAAPAGPARADADAKYRVAIVPVALVGSPKPRLTEVAPKIVQKAFTDRGFDVVFGQPVIDACTKLDAKPEGMLPAYTLRRIGKALDAKYVVAARYRVTSDTPFVTWRFRSKAAAWVDARIVEVPTGRVVLDHADGDQPSSSRKVNDDIVQALMIYVGALPVPLNREAHAQCEAVGVATLAVFDEFFSSVSQGPSAQGH